jgi:hypothetical protein
VRLYGIFKTEHGIIAVGKHTGVANDMPVSGVPSWGNSTFNNESAVVAYFRAANIENTNDSPVVITTVGNEENSDSQLNIAPNPADGSFTIDLGETQYTSKITVTNMLGEVVYMSTVAPTKFVQISTSGFASGVYLVQVQSETGLRTQRVVVQ